MIRKRIARLDDDAVYQLIVAELAPFTKMTMPDLSLNSEMIKRHLDNNITYVAVQGLSPFGFISFRNEGDKLFIDMLAVDRMQQSRGWGAQMMAVAERLGIRKRCKWAQLYVDEVNEKAIRFYLRLGYVIEKHVPVVRCYLLSKRLNRRSIIKA